MEVLITGGNGFIGSHVADLLLAQGNRVKLLDVNFDWRTAGSNADKINCDVLDYDGLRGVSESAEVILHFAAVSRVKDGEADPGRCASINVGGTTNVIRAACEASKTLIFSSSREVYGDSSAPCVVEDSPKRPISAYASSKLAAENSIIEAGRTRGLRYTIVRLSNVFGSVRGRRERVIPTFVRQALAGEPLTIYGGSQCMDFTLVDDVAAIVASLAENPERAREQDYNVVSGQSYTVNELAQMVRDLTHSKSDFVFDKEESCFARRFVGSPAKLNALTGRRNSVRGLREGLRLYVNRVTESQLTEAIRS